MEGDAELPDLELYEAQPPAQCGDETSRDGCFAWLLSHSNAQTDEGGTAVVHGRDNVERAVNTFQLCSMSAWSHKLQFFRPYKEQGVDNVVAIDPNLLTATPRLSIKQPGPSFSLQNRGSTPSPLAVPVDYRFFLRQQRVGTRAAQDVVSWREKLHPVRVPGQKERSGSESGCDPVVAPLVVTPIGQHTWFPFTRIRAGSGSRSGPWSLLASVFPGRGDGHELHLKWRHFPPSFFPSMFSQTVATVHTSPPAVVPSRTQGGRIAHMSLEGICRNPKHKFGVAAFSNLECSKGSSGTKLLSVFYRYWDQREWMLNGTTGLKGTATRFFKEVSVQPLVAFGRMAHGHFASAEFTAKGSLTFPVQWKKRPEGSTATAEVKWPSVLHYFSSVADIAKALRLRWYFNSQMPIPFFIPNGESAQQQNFERVTQMCCGSLVRGLPPVQAPPSSSCFTSVAAASIEAVCSIWKFADIAAFVNVQGILFGKKRDSFSLLSPSWMIFGTVGYALQPRRVGQTMNKLGEMEPNRLELAWSWPLLSLSDRETAEGGGDFVKKALQRVRFGVVWNFGGYDEPLIASS